MIEKAVSYFFGKRWPKGFECPSCGHGKYYVVSSRRLPLYQCRLCKHQTTVTAGTVMHRSRTSLDKWVAAMELLSAEAGVNATRLAASVGVSHKAAWTLLRKLRSAIAETEAHAKLSGTVHAAVQWLKPGYLFLSTSHKRYRKERIVLLGTSVDGIGGTKAIKLRLVDEQHLIPRTKELSREGTHAELHKVASPGAIATLLTDRRLVNSSLPARFKEAEQWLNRVFNGFGSKYLQSYLDEYCFRWNIAAGGHCPKEVWTRLFFRAPSAR